MSVYYFRARLAVRAVYGGVCADRLAGTRSQGWYTVDTRQSAQVSRDRTSLKAMGSARFSLHSYHLFEVRAHAQVLALVVEVLRPLEETPKALLVFLAILQIDNT